jgi:DNA helicase-2/ATP-dependent DNA helicase PcrA
LIPHERSLRENDRQQLEEERRLLFVGITRAKDRLVLTQTQRREMHGRTLSTITSDFLRELMVERRDCTGMSDSDFESADPSMFVDPYARNPYDDSSDEGQQTAADRSREARPLRGLASNRDQAKRRKSKKMPHLTTGAALEAGTSDAAALPIGFSTGMQVRHPRYGLGTVVEVSGFSRMRTITVEFDAGNRRESFVASKCPLQPVGLS